MLYLKDMQDDKCLDREGHAFGIAVDIVATHVKVSGFQSWLHTWLQLPASLLPEMQQMMAQELEALLPSGDTQTEF